MLGQICVGHICILHIRPVGGPVVRLNLLLDCVRNNVKRFAPFAFNLDVVYVISLMSEVMSTKLSFTDL